mgnify:CR=1 FL=1
MKGFSKGHIKVGGRKKGIENRTTKEAREILDQILFAEIDNVAAALKEIRDKNKMAYLDMYSKLLAYSLPKKTDITSDGENITPTSVTIRIIKNES